MICGELFFTSLIISIALDSKEVTTVIPTISTVFNALISFFSSKSSAAKSRILTSSFSFSRVFAI